MTTTSSSQLLLAPRILPRLSMTTVWLITPILLVGIVVWTNTDFPADYWMHANLGRCMWQHRDWIRVDTLTHTIAGQPVRNQAWLAQLLLYALAAAGGYSLAQFIAGLIYAASWLLIVYATYRRCRRARITAALALLALGATLSNVAVRPQMFSVFLFSALLAVLWRRSRSWWTVGAIAAIQLAWVNLHGAFPLGIVVVAIFVLGRAIDVGLRHGIRAILDDLWLRRLVWGLGAALLVSLVNPNGFQIVGYVTGVSTRAAARHIEEWLPPTLHSVAGIALFASIGLTVAVLGTSDKPLRATELLLLIAFLVLAARAQRMVIWWVLVLPAILAPHIARLTALCQVRKSALPVARDYSNTFVLGLLLLFGLFSTPWTRPYNFLLPNAKRRCQPQDMPTGALAFLRNAHYHGRMFQPMEWGAVVSWVLGPDARVFVDSRIDFFPDRVWQDYVTICRQPQSADSILDRYGVDTVLLDRNRNQDLIAQLDRSSRWHRAYADQLAVIYRCRIAHQESKSSNSASGSGSTGIE